MRVRMISGLSLGLALAASAAAAQQPTQQSKASEQRIVVSKGEVQLAAPETVFVRRIDTVRVVRVDTVRMPRMMMRAHVDTVVQVIPLVPAVPRGPVYAGTYAGVTTPTGNLDRLYSTGMHLGLVAGWQEPRRFLSVRGRGDVTQLDREGAFGMLVGNRSPVMFGFGADLKMTLPGFDWWAPYAIGGAGFNYFRGMATASESRNALCGMDRRGGCYAPAQDDHWSSEFAFGFGGGVDFDFAHQGLFLEARAQAVQADKARSWFVPVSLGIRFF